MQLPDGTAAAVTALANDGNGQVDAQVTLTWPDGAVTTMWLRIEADVRAACGVLQRTGVARVRTPGTTGGA